MLETCAHLFFLVLFVYYFISSSSSRPLDPQFTWEIRDFLENAQPIQAKPELKAGLWSEKILHSECVRQSLWEDDLEPVVSDTENRLAVARGGVSEGGRIGGWRISRMQYSFFIIFFALWFITGY